MTTDSVGERLHLDACGDTFRTRIDAPADERGFFGIVPPNSATSEVLLGEASARELRDRLNAYLGEAVRADAGVGTAVRGGWRCPLCPRMVFGRSISACEGDRWFEDGEPNCIVNEDDGRAAPQTHPAALCGGRAHPHERR